MRLRRCGQSQLRIVRLQVPPSARWQPWVHLLLREFSHSSYFTTAVRTCAGSAESVQAITISSPDATIRGTPPDRTPVAPDMLRGDAPVPFAAKRRIWTWGACP